MSLIVPDVVYVDILYYSIDIRTGSTIVTC